MARMVVIYRTPKDVEAFDRHKFEIHVPLAKKIPGLRKYEVSDGPIATPVGTSNVHRIGTLHFDDLRLGGRGGKMAAKWRAAAYTGRKDRKVRRRGLSDVSNQS